MKNDISFALVQTVREGWDTTSELFHVCLANDPEGCFIAESDGERVGMATTTCYEQSAWIGNVIVLPEFRGRGIGRRLMTHAMDHLSQREVRTIRLEADPPGIPLYKSLGFVEEFESLRFRRDAEIDPERTSAESLTRNHLPGLQRFDMRCFGDNRSAVLELLLLNAKTAYRLSGRDTICGYIFTWPSRQGTRIGPWVATDPDTAEKLLTAALAGLCGHSAILGVPATNPTAAPLLERYGFQKTPSCTRMIYGSHRAAGSPEHIYAIGNGAMG